ncbi:hypothetical protein FRC07_000126 [Ceratobasidium sp. 392]|nr:hypothetical protein FRC07_000126 [Ceratobasidium sp. 392]
MAERLSELESSGNGPAHTIDEDMRGSDGEIMADAIGALSFEDIRQQRVASEQRRRNDLRGGFA